MYSNKSYGEIQVVNEFRSVFHNGITKIKQMIPIGIITQVLAPIILL